ncbi:MAG: aminomethyltransferase family protein, partial [Acetobacteraceae bacterium]|nr:aminomethyltransferase family protein [Acetobacteraceae bacterium]
MNVYLDETRHAGPLACADAARRILVPGGGCAPFELRRGDRLRIADPEGLQPGTLFILPADPARPPVIAAPPGGTLEDALAAAGAGAEAAHAAFAARGDVLSFQVLGEGGAPGSSFACTATAPARCLLFASGAAMAPDGQNPPTALHVEIEGAEPLAGEQPAPPPLAEAKLDLRVKAATAAAYRVQAGDYIQVIDVAGRQCSDFLAFDAAALARGEERGLDLTATHTLMGSTSPGPGLHSKYFNAELQPMVEVIRDTVGRHDTFMLACSAKYYDDMGYPGHANCTDNFNAALKSYGIAPRKGWPAINFFYNTFIDNANAIRMDEPWSRPGDYVLLRALTDLVCASSSCADDIDPANGWQPTDIHVRLYDKGCNFSKGIAHRMTPDAEPVLTRESSFHSRTGALTRNFAEYRGFWLPTCFSNEGPVSEYWACRERAAVTDLSALRKFEVTGPDAEALMQRAVTRDLRKLAVGQVVYTALCFEHGGMMDDGTVFRLGPQNFRLVCGDEYCGVWLRDLAQKHGLKAWVRSSTDQLHNIAVQGPRSRDVLRDVVVTPPHQPSLAELKWFRFTVGRIGGPQGPAVLVSRTGYTGELGYEVWCHPGQAPAVWDAVWEAGRPHGLAPMGLAALDMVRVEAGLVFAGYEFCDQTDPFEAGIGFTVPAD